MGLAPLLRLTSNNKKILLKKRPRSNEVHEFTNKPQDLNRQSSFSSNSSSQQTVGIVQKKPKLVVEKPMHSLDSRLKSGSLKRMTLKKTSSM